MLISRAEEEGTEAMIRPQGAEGGKDSSSAWVGRTAVTRGLVRQGQVTSAEPRPLEAMTYSKNSHHT